MRGVGVFFFIIACASASLFFWFGLYVCTQPTLRIL